jgi:hypothetical protein
MQSAAADLGNVSSFVQISPFSYPLYDPAISLLGMYSKDLKMYAPNKTWIIEHFYSELLKLGRNQEVPR